MAQGRRSHLRQSRAYGVQVFPGPVEGLLHQRFKAVGVGGQRALAQPAAGVHLHVQHLGKVGRLGFQKRHVVRGKPVQSKAFPAGIRHLVGVGALHGQYALVQAEVIHPGALLTTLSGGRGQVYRQLKAQPVPGLVQGQWLAAALVVDHSQITALRPFVDAVDPSFQRAFPAPSLQRAFSAHRVHGQPGHAVLNAEIRLQRGGCKAAAPHVPGQHGGAGPGSGLQAPALGQRHGAVAQGAVAGHGVQQPVGNAVHAPSGLAVFQPVQILHAGQQEFVHGAVEEGTFVPHVQLKGFNALRVQAVAGEVSEGTPRVELQPGYALAAQGPVQRAGRVRIQRVSALAVAQRQSDLLKGAPRAGIVQSVRDLPKPRQGRGIPGLGGFAFAHPGKGPGCVGHGRHRRAAQHPLHAFVLRQAAAHRQRRENALQQRQQRAGMLGAAVQPTKGRADAQVFAGRFHRGLQVEAAHPRQLHAVRAQPSPGQAGKGLGLGGIQQPVGVYDGPVGLTQDQQCFGPLGGDAVGGLGVDGVAGLGEGFDNGGVQRFRQGLPQFRDGQRFPAHQLGHLVQRPDDAVPNLALLAGLLPKTAL